MKEQIVQRARELGFDDCRITTAAPPPHTAEFQEWLAQGRHGTMGYLERNSFKRINPNEVLTGAKSVIVLATAYSPEQRELSNSEPRGLVARYAQHADYHDILAQRLKELTDFVNSVGGPETKSLWYVDTGPLLERDLAQRAGLGFAGKHTNLISRLLGNWFFISEIITTLELPIDEPERNRCGTCTRCLEACPTNAITAPFQLDARRCISYLTIELKGSIPEEFRPAIGNRIYGCDICLEVCPWNKFAKEGAIMKQHERADLDQPALLELLGLDDAQFKARFAGTPMLRTKRRGVLRNVCVALGNIGDKRCLAALERASLDHEPLIAEHAAWAIAQIKKRLAAKVIAVEVAASMRA
ncbi:MAG TPA: tRNA epoxyqueuosine(34) reductase QueG [Verrucomicrobiae bacterium]